MGSLEVSDNLKGTKQIKVDLISTINMSANSIYEFKKVMVNVLLSLIWK